MDMIVARSRRLAMYVQSTQQGLGGSLHIQHTYLSGHNVLAVEACRIGSNLAGGFADASAYLPVAVAVVNLDAS